MNRLKRRTGHVVSIRRNLSPVAATIPVSDPAANISSSDYARKCKNLMDLNNDLRAMGASTFIDLPRIAVIGGQSAGKSSLVEAVSGINVPRDSGTCTRCPLECSMSSSAESWSCKISLRFDYDAAGQRVISREVPFGLPLTDKNDVEIWLRRAQLAVLSSHMPADTFLTKTYHDLQTARTEDDQILEFSKNVVCLSIEDPEATDLSFIDLPGLIQNAAPESVEMVKNLIVSYIEQEKTIILITIPMSDDMENQQAVRLAREADPGGDRTIGVLTKPDTLGAGATNSRILWKELLEGRGAPRHSLKNGYYSVRLPDDLERSQNLTRSESQLRATTFFDTTSPWREITDRGCFGIPALISDMSQLLLQLIEDGIPKLKLDVNRRLAECQSELDKFPPPPLHEPTAEIIRLINAFCDELKGAVYGEGIKVLAQQNRARYTIFKADIRGTAPDFRPFVEPGSVDGYAPPPSEDESGSTYQRNPKVVPLGLRDVRKVIADSIGWELPHNVPFEAKKTLIMQSIDLWTTPALRCFNDVFTNLSNFVDSRMLVHFARFKPLQSYIGSLTEREIGICKEQTCQTIKKTLELEKGPLFTQNTHYLDTARDKWFRHYRTPFPDPPEEHCAVYVGTPEKHHAVFPDFGTRVVTHVPSRPAWREDWRGEWCDEFEVMAEVRGYFQVAYKRIIDYIPLTIEHELNQAIVGSLQTVLIRSLFTDGNAEWRKSLLAEDPAIAAKREILEGTKQRLNEIRKRLDSIDMEPVINGV